MDTTMKNTDTTAMICNEKKRKRRELAAILKTPFGVDDNTVKKLTT
jgi:hypothetical protein